MFDMTVKPTSSPTTVGAAVDAATVAGWRAALVEVGHACDGLDDAGRVDLIRALEELTCSATSAQAALAADLDESQRATQAAHGVPAAQQGRGVRRRWRSRDASPTRTPHLAG